MQKPIPNGKKIRDFIKNEFPEISEKKLNSISELVNNQRKKVLELYTEDTRVEIAIKEDPTDLKNRTQISDAILDYVKSEILITESRLKKSLSKEQLQKLYHQIFGGHGN